MYQCKSGKHYWLSSEDAGKCCNGYIRCLGVHSVYNTTFYGYYWLKKD